MDIGLEELKDNLGFQIPSDYELYVNSHKKDELEDIGFDPKTLCVLNLDLRFNNELIDSDRNWAHDKFFLTGDGCGNYYYLPAKDHSSNVLLWSHDPEGIEDSDKKLNEFLLTETQENPITKTVDSDELVITKTKVIGESILNPITLGEWKNAMLDIDHIYYRGYRSGKNPFTSESVKFDMPGLAIVKDFGNEIEFRLFSGRVAGINGGEVSYEVANKLADKLNAYLVVG